MKKEFSFPYMEVGLLGGAVLPLVVAALTKDSELGLRIGEIELALLLIGVFVMGEKKA